MTSSEVASAEASSPEVVLSGTASSEGIGVGWSGLIGVAAALIGLLPWLITGMRLPLQNLWAVEVLPAQMPLVPLPYSQYALVAMAGLLITGTAAAGLAARLLRERTGRWGKPAIFFGVIVMQAAAIVQTTAVTRAGLEHSEIAKTYLLAVTGAATLAVFIGAGVFWLVAVAPRAGALIGFAIAALALGEWLGALAHPITGIRAGVVADIAQVAGRIFGWAPAVAVGIALGWCGVRSAGRIIAALVGLLLLWLTPPLADAVGYAAGSRVLGGDLSQMADAASHIFRSEVFSPGLVLPPLTVALIVAVVVALLVRRRAAGAMTSTGLV